MKQKYTVLGLFLIFITHTVFAENIINTNHLQNGINRVAKHQLLPGALAYIKTPTQNLTITYGYSDVHKKEAPHLSQHFRIGSNTKSMISAVILQMAQDNLLKLDEPVSNYITPIPNGDKITLAMLMQNRSGLFNYLDDPSFSKELDKDIDKHWTQQELLQIAFKHPSTAPNEKFHYCNTNFVLLGMIAEKIDQKPLHKIFEDRLFKPLNMKNTYLPHDDQYSMRQPFARGYGYGDLSHVINNKHYTSDEQINARRGITRLRDYTDQSASWSWAAGAVVSTPEDLAIWIKALSEGKLFNKKFHEEWKKGFVALDKVNNYGYGVLKHSEENKIFYFHNGQLPGFNTYMVYYPKKQITAIVWTNMAFSITNELPAEALIRVVDREVMSR